MNASVQRLKIPGWDRKLPERGGLADDFVQFRFRLAAAEGEGGGEMFPVVQREAVELLGDEGFQRGAFFYVAWILEQLLGRFRQLLLIICQLKIWFATIRAQLFGRQSSRDESATTARPDQVLVKRRSANLHCSSCKQHEGLSAHRLRLWICL